MRAIVVVNCGSSSVKLDVFSAQGLELAWSGVVERIGTDGASLTSEVGSERASRAVVGVDHQGALGALLDAQGITA